MTFVRIRAGVALTIALAAGVLGWTQTAARAAFPGGNGLIAWTRPFFLTDSEIYVMNPDGTQVVFSRQKMDGTGAIWIINADGTGLHRITGEVSQNSHPNWSPDGTHIVFESDRSGG